MTGKKEKENSQYALLDPAKIKELLHQHCLGRDEWYAKSGVDPRTGRRVFQKLPIKWSSARAMLQALYVKKFDEFFLEETVTEETVLKTQDKYRQIQEWTAFDVPTPITTASNGLQFRTYPLEHNHLDRYAWGKCYELCHLPDSEREEYQAYLLRHPQVCERLKSSPYFPQVETTCPDPNGIDWWVLDEWSEGEYLSDKLESHEMTFPVAMSVLRQSAVALHELHEQDIVLRELSPQRIWLLADSPQIQLVDLELAKLLDGNPSVSQEKWPVDPYRAPEIDSGRCDHRADLYSWGQLAVRLLSGQLLDLGTIPNSITDYPISKRQTDLIKQCLSILPSKRPNSMDIICKAFVFASGKGNK